MPSAVAPQPPWVGALQPNAVDGAGTMASALQSTRGEEGRGVGVGQYLQLAGGPEGALASRRRLALPAPL